MNTSQPGRYGVLSIGLHWLMLLLLVAVYASMELRGIFPKGSALYNGMKTWHYMLGLSVFGLVWMRLAARLQAPAPPVSPALPQWQLRFSQTMHVALYLLMIALPLLGWLVLSASGKPVPFFGLELPALIAESKANAKLIKDVHETIATAGYFLVGLHAAAALFHHYVVRDDTLKRMLPFRTSRT